MDRMKTKFIIAVSSRLAAAGDCNAKTDLIEELSENLYRRYLDLVGCGMEEEAAYSRALEDLGDVEELLEYLRGLGPDGRIPAQESKGSSFRLDDLLRGTEDIVRETIEQTRDAVDQAKVIVKDVTRRLKEKYPGVFQGEPHFTVDFSREGSAGGTQGSADIPDGDIIDVEISDVDFPGVGSGVEGTVFPSESLTCLDVQVTGDVTIRLAQDSAAPVTLAGDVEQLEVRLSEEGVLSVRPFRTASASFFTRHGLSSADVELTLPARRWEEVRITSRHGDVTVEEAIDAGEVSIRGVSGDVLLHGVSGALAVDIVSGDVDLRGSYGQVRVNVASGDIDMEGRAPAIHCSSASGDIDLRLETLPPQLQANSASGDVDVAVPDGQGFTLSFRTVSGDLETGFPLVGPIGSRSGEAVYLDGGQSRLSIASISGDITLRRR